MMGYLNEPHECATPWSLTNGTVWQCDDDQCGKGVAAGEPWQPEVCPVASTRPPRALDARGEQMRREERFVLSHRPYAVELGSLTVGPASFCQVSAVWFRRRRGATVACIGYLWDYQGPSVAHPDRKSPASVGEFLERHSDGRYGGTTEGRWDGERYWGAQEPDMIEQHLALLRPMLDGYPACPDGLDGWWTFRDV